MGMFLYTSVGVHRGQQYQIPQERDLQVLVSQLTWVLGITFGPSGRVARLLPAEPSLQPQNEYVL